METYGAIEGINYALRARKTTAIKPFNTETTNEPVDRTMCRIIRSAVNRRKLKFQREEKEKCSGLWKSRKPYKVKRQ